MIVDYEPTLTLVFYVKEPTQKSSLGKAESPLESLFEIWNEENQAIRIERLTSLERLHDYIVPRIPEKLTSVHQLLVLGLVEYTSTNPSEAKLGSGEESTSEDPNSPCSTKQQSASEDSTNRSNPELTRDQEDRTTAVGCTLW
ncbi:hypothetical protein TNCV_229091 [Trichonephila clavipes]|nr:hypothetical protein TNCV_229091 [Trichonephila clavipes]